MRTTCKPTFLTYQKPLLCCMVQGNTASEDIDIISAALYDGAEAFGIQLECLELNQREPETLKSIFNACDNRPIYVTSYRGSRSEGFADEQCAELLLAAADAGATLCDVVGDFFCKGTNDMTWDPVAVEKQKALIEMLHVKGCEVLMSSHMKERLNPAEVMRYALTQQERGADVVKIVNICDTEERLLEDLQNIVELKNTLKSRFLYLGGGAYSKLLRQFGASLGVCMYLCAPFYSPKTTRAQPLLRNMKAIRDNLG